MMLWFDRLFPPAMILFPALITLFVRRHPAVGGARAARLPRALWSATAFALLVHVAAQAAYERGAVFSASGHGVWTLLFTMASFMSLWFGLAVRVLAARDPGWRNANGPSRTTRSASLVPRHEASPAPTVLVALGWALYAVYIAATGWAIAESTHALALLAGAIFWPGFAWGARASRLESEPRDAAGSPGLAAAYAALRRVKVVGFLLCGIAGSVLFATTAVLVVLAPEGAAYVGGFGGAAVGLCGGALGTLVSIRRARIQARLVELEGRAEGPAAPTDRSTDGGLASPAG